MVSGHAASDPWLLTQSLAFDVLIGLIGGVAALLGQGWFVVRLAGVFGGLVGFLVIAVPFACIAEGVLLANRWRYGGIWYVVGSITATTGCIAYAYLMTGKYGGALKREQNAWKAK